MHWLEEWRTAHQMSQKTLALQVGVSEQLIWNIENGKGYGFTQPLIANDIADFTGATAAQRDSLVHPKHHGTYKPNPKRRKKMQRAKPESKAEEKRNTNRREVLAISEGGVIVGTFSGLNAAAGEYFPCTAMTVCNRCARRLCPTVNEFLPYGVTFRYADEWLNMTDEQQLNDIRRARGKNRVYGGQKRKEEKQCK